LKEEEPVKLGRYWLTSSPQRLQQQSILLRHHYRQLIPKALIQLDGHLHFGQRIQNYLNLGFLYRDEAHGTSAMVGCYWTLELEGTSASVSFTNLGGKLKEYKCPNHPKEGTFYIPFYWKKCPVCNDSKNALVQSPQVSRTHGTFPD
jgi:hypothetical protein